MQIGMIGLGRMGANMVRRLAKAGHECVVYDRAGPAAAQLAEEGAIPSATLAEMKEKLRPPRAVWMMVPAAVVDGVIGDLTSVLEDGDIVIDGGNSYYRDDIERAARLRPAGIHYVDCGTSGGVWGLERGYCLMIGGEKPIVDHLVPIFRSLAPGQGSIPRTPGREGARASAEEGYLHCGPHGAGHFVKMVHNGIEYGVMAAYAEGFGLLERAGIGSEKHSEDAETAPLRDPRFYRYEFDLKEIAEVWRRGSVIASWLLDLTAEALVRSPDLSEFSGRVSDSGEGRWTVLAAVEAGVPAHVLTASLYERFDSRGHAEFQNRVLSAMRFGFGGHHEKKEEK